MYFDAIANGYSAITEKQRLNLSDRAMTILLHDCMIFEPNKKAETESGGITSPLVNKIFRCWRENARASILLRLRDKRAELTGILGTDVEPAQREAILNRVLEAYQRELTMEAERLCSVKEFAFSFRFDKDNFEYLRGEGNGEGAYFHDNVGLYVKAVIEEYCELPYVERERIYCREIIRTEGVVRANGGTLKLRLHQPDARTGRPRLVYLKPFGILQDSENMYNYLVGEGSSSLEGDGSIQSIRLTSVESADELSRRGFLSAKQKSEIEKLIRRRGVQYLYGLENEVPVRVRLTENGEDMYRRIRSQRPEKKRTVGDHEYEFDCTLFHAQVYFFRFGPDAKILAPAELAERLRELHRAAAAQYETGPSDTPQLSASGRTD